jgi:beta-phosphoglucomutase-like phosphatase (HAD superfamily)
MSTGNARPVARWKMHRTGLCDLLHAGGFGHRSRERRDVVRRAVAELTGGGPATGVLVGDTVSDVHAARAAGLGCVAVATGAASAADLAAAGADAVLPDLTGTLALSTMLNLLDDGVAGPEAAVAARGMRPGREVPLP